jgi:O-antigen/teichoic acid export membrane protein
MLTSLFDGSAFVFDRYFLDKQMDLAAIGLYAVGMQIAGGYNVFNLIFKMAWHPFLYRIINEREDSPKVVGLFSTYSLAVLAIPAFAIALLAGDLFRLLGNSEYFAVGLYVPLFVLGYYCLSIGTAMGRGLELSKANESSPIVPIVSVVASFGLSYLLVPAYGLWGAASSFVLVAIIRSFVQIYLANRVYPRPFYWKKLMGMFLILSLGWVVGSMITTSSLLIGILLKLLVIKVTALALLRITLGEEFFYGFLKSLRLIKTESPTARE